MHVDSRVTQPCRCGTFLRYVVAALLALLQMLLATSAFAQDQIEAPALRFGSRVPADVEQIYERGLRFLAQNQGEGGSWSGRSGAGGEHGITGLCVMAFLASGEDPNFGRYSSSIRRGLQNMIQGQDARTGFFDNSMYHHGFAMLAMAEAYGTVDDSLLWSDGAAAPSRRTIGESLELAVRAALTSQKSNQWGGWRYSPQSTDADTSVSGAVLMGLLAARNAGIEVPDEAAEKALKYFRTSTSKTGMVAYSGGVGGFGESMNRSSIGTLVFAIGKKKDWEEFSAALGHISQRLEHRETQYLFYFRYYMAQALFQGDFDAWDRWNRETIRQLRQEQADDGSFTDSHGKPFATAMSLLALALNYRFLPIYER